MAAHAIFLVFFKVFLITSNNILSISNKIGNLAILGMQFLAPSFSPLSVAHSKTRALRLVAWNKFVTGWRGLFGGWGLLAGVWVARRMG